jgi:hypothetical protein
MRSSLRTKETRKADNKTQPRLISDAHPASSSRHSHPVHRPQQLVPPIRTHLILWPQIRHLIDLPLNLLLHRLKRRLTILLLCLALRLIIGFLLLRLLVVRYMSSFRLSRTLVSLRFLECVLFIVEGGACAVVGSVEASKDRRGYVHRGYRRSMREKRRKLRVWLGRTSDRSGEST